MKVISKTLTAAAAVALGLATPALAQNAAADDATTTFTTTQDHDDDSPWGLLGLLGLGGLLGLKRRDRNDDDRRTARGTTTRP